MIQLPEGFDSIFRYIVVISQRAEQLVNGAKPRCESRHDKPTLVAIDDVLEGKVEWRILSQEELDAQRQAIVDQLRAEVGVDEVDEVADGAIPDVLPTGDAAAAVEVVAGAVEEGEKDDELVRLQKLLGMTGAAKEAEAADDAEEKEAAAEEPVTIDLEAAAEELEGSADDKKEEEN